jgi:hypothetical protein
MIEEEINRRKEIFAEWLTFIGDRVKEWKRTLSKETSSQLDWTPQSLTIIERYLLDHFKLSDQNNKDKRTSLDAIVSYTGEVFRKHIPETVWKIDVEDTSNIFYNLPYLVFKLGVPVCPHYLIQDALTNKTGSELSERFNQRFKKWTEYKTYMEIKKT